MTNPAVKNKVHFSPLLVTKKKISERKIIKLKKSLYQA